MKKFIAICLCLFVCLGVCACGKKNDINVPMGMMLASDESITDYVLMVPNDWTIESTTGTTTAYYRDNLSEAVLATFSATFNVPSSADVTLENYFDGYKNEFASVFGNAESIEERETCG